MRITLGSKSRFEPGSIMETIVDYATGTYTGSVRATQIIGSWLYANTIRPFGNHVLRLNLSPGMRPKVENGKIKVAAVGFGRTGTVRFVDSSVVHRYNMRIPFIFSFDAKNLKISTCSL
jgi:hypothetical protein